MSVLEALARGLRACCSAEKFAARGGSKIGVGHIKVFPRAAGMELTRMLAPAGGRCVSPMILAATSLYALPCPHIRSPRWIAILN